jgi:hypothetical protein
MGSDASLIGNGMRSLTLPDSTQQPLPVPAPPSAAGHFIRPR